MAELMADGRGYEGAHVPANNGAHVIDELVGNADGELGHDKIVPGRSAHATGVIGPRSRYASPRPSGSAA